MEYGKRGMVPEAEVRRREREAYTEGHADGWEVRDNNQTWTSKDTEQEAARRYPDPTATQEPAEPDPQRGPINADAAQDDAAVLELLRIAECCIARPDRINMDSLLSRAWGMQNERIIARAVVQKEGKHDNQI